VNVISVANQKGGCGKTTTAINMAWSLTELNLSVLLVDMDPQGHASLGLGFDTELLDRTVRDTLVRPAASIDEVVLPFSKDLHVVPANVSLAPLEQELADQPERESRLRAALAACSRKYDRVVIDCPPSLGFLTINALVASDEVIIPLETSSFSLQGLERLLDTVELVERNTGRRLLCQALATSYDGRTRYGRSFHSELVDRFRDRLFETTIRRSVLVKEAAARGLPVGKTHRHSRVHNDYLALATEVIESAPVVEVKDLDEWREKLFGPSVVGREVVFRIDAPQAARVGVAGTFNGWDPGRGAMSKDRISGVWTLTIELPPGSHQYRFVVDGEWIEDPANQAREEAPGGFLNSVVLVGEDS